MFTALLILQVIVGLSIIGLVLLQRGKGADMGAAFGAGASGTVFGSGGGGSFLTRVTAVLAFVFFANSILLSSPLVLKPMDPSASVTSTATEESDTLATEEIVVEEAIDLPPADLPDAESLFIDESTADDVPAMPEDAPAADAPPADKTE